MNQFRHKLKIFASSSIKLNQAKSNLVALFFMPLSRATSVDCLPSNPSDSFRLGKIRQGNHCQGNGNMILVHLYSPAFIPSLVQSPCAVWLRLAALRHLSFFETCTLRDSV
jgi:hypothetical protein